MGELHKGVQVFAKGLVVSLTVLLTGVSSGLSAEEIYQSKASREISKLQSEFGGAFSDRAIVYLDKDEIFYQLGRMGLLNDSEAQIDFIQEYISKIAGFQAPRAESDQIWSMAKAGLVVALPFMERQAETGPSLCVVSPADPNLNSRESMERLVTWHKFKDTDFFKGKDFQKIPSQGKLAAFSNYHETFHCLDHIHLPRAQAAQHNYDDVEPHIHRAETFAEVGSQLYLGQSLNDPNLLDHRIPMRVVGSFMTGRFMELLGPRFDLTSWGAVYSFHRALFQTKKEIREKRMSWSLPDILQKATQITETQSMNSAEFYAISHFQADPLELKKMTNEYLEGQTEGLVYERFTAVKNSYLAYEKVLDWAFRVFLRPSNSKRGSSEKELESLPREFRASTHCRAYFGDSGPDRKTYFQRIDQLRKTHYEKNMSDSALGDHLNRLPECLSVKKSFESIVR